MLTHQYEPTQTGTAYLTEPAFHDAVMHCWNDPRQAKAHKYAGS